MSPFTVQDVWFLSNLNGRLSWSIQQPGMLCAACTSLLESRGITEMVIGHGGR